jgi:hypothetical protein
VAPRRWAHGQDQEGRLPVLIRVVEEELRLLLFLALRRFAGNVASCRNAIVDSAQTSPLQNRLSSCAQSQDPPLHRDDGPDRGSAGVDPATARRMTRSFFRRGRGSHRAAPANRRRTLIWPPGQPRQTTGIGPPGSHVS